MEMSSSRSRRTRIGAGPAAVRHGTTPLPHTLCAVPGVHRASAELGILMARALLYP